MTTEELKKNGNELAELLKDRLHCEIDWLKLLLTSGSAVSGTHSESNFNITVQRDAYLLVSVKVSAMNLLESMKPLLMTYMGDAQPICQYVLTYDDGKMVTLEWDILDPKARISEIVNGKVGNVEDLVLFGYDLAEFTHPEMKRQFEEQEAERIKNARIYGIDPGCIKPEDGVEDWPEWKLFSTIDALGGYIWWQHHEESHGRCEHVDTTEQKYGIAYLVNQTRKYGVELAEPQVDETLSPTESYQKWYAFWKQWMKSFSDEVWSVVNAKISKGEDISEYLPKNSWKE
ncbi:MAG: hypothetical protein LBD11_08115 [Candidatus Peribacteria bacterium]|jgi:hypothetical protein|nr:hypothetical protein [Candidatus Peribacteria bacterium]